MKSSSQQLSSRGFISDEDIVPFLHLTQKECFVFLESTDPRKRTIAARLLSSYTSEKTIKLLAEKLIVENKLYPRIALCETLASFGVHSAKTLCGMLGRIGGNQHRSVPEKAFMKKSYPLPRDIAARTLAGMGTDVLPELLNVLRGKDRVAIREAIDAVGHISFYHRTDHPLESILRVLEKNHDDEVIRWKIVRALSAFNQTRSIDILKRIIAKDPDERIRREAERSLGILSSVAGENIKRDSATGSRR